MEEQFHGSAVPSCKFFRNGAVVLGRVNGGSIPSPTKKVHVVASWSRCRSEVSCGLPTPRLLNGITERGHQSPCVSV